MNGTKWTRALMVFGLVGLAACGGGETAEEAEVEEAPAAEAAPTLPDAPVIQAADLANAAAHEGMPVRVNGLTVNSAVGTNAVFVNLPTTPQPTPFMVYFPSPPVPAAGRTFDVVGTVKPITPELVEGWVTAGTITENDKLMVEFATHYLESQAVQAAGM